jgi:hypothetical protein
VQKGWSDERGWRKSVWVNAERLECPKRVKKSVWVNAERLECPKRVEEKRLGQCREAGLTEEGGGKVFGSMQRGWSDRRGWRKSVWVNAEGLE